MDKNYSIVLEESNHITYGSIDSFKKTSKNAMMVGRQLELKAIRSINTNMNTNDTTV